MLLDEVKDYLRVDSDTGEDDQIGALITAARLYIENQTGKRYDGTNEVWNICIKLLVSHWYDNRQLNPSKPGTLDEFPHSVSALILHISLCGAYPQAVTP